ncbi:hypothetical protein ACROYT_G019382 [Oculina patagonica]
MCTHRGKTTSQYCLALLCLSAFVARTARSNEVCSEFVYLGGKYGTHTGRFASPGYPSGTYPNKERCTWIIKVPLDYRVGLYFSDFDIESCSSGEKNCTCDYVEISDGQLLIDKSLAKFCGSKTPPSVLSSGRFLRVDLVTNELNDRKGFQAHFYSVSPDGVTPSSIGVDDDKHLRTLTTPTDKPKKGSDHSTTMIAVICSLLGVVLIGLILLFFHRKKKKHAQENQRRCAQLQLASPVSGVSQRNQLPCEPPPPYSSVVASAPPPYSSSAALQNRDTYT